MRQSRVTVSAISIPGLWNTGLHAESTMNWGPCAVAEECNLGKSGVWNGGIWERGQWGFGISVKTQRCLPSTLCFLHHVCWLLLIFKNPWSTCSLNCRGMVGGGSGGSGIFSAMKPPSLPFPAMLWWAANGVERLASLHWFLAITVNKLGDLTMLPCFS